MKKLFSAASVYLVLGLASGMFYREFTKAQGYTAADGFTQLSVAHTHLLTLGTIVLLIVLALEKTLELSRSSLFGWFFWLYNLGLIITAGAMVTNGVLHVLGTESNSALAGIAGAGHVIITAALLLLFIALGTRVFATSSTRETTA